MNEERKQLFLEKMKKWIEPYPGDNQPYYRPFNADKYCDRWPVFLVGTNPATPMNPSYINAHTYANMLLDQLLFTEHYTRLRQSSKKTKMSPSRRAIKKITGKIQSSTGSSVLETNVIPYPTSSEKDIAHVPEKALTRAKEIFLELLLDQRPSVIITHGKVAANELIELLKRESNIIFLQHPPDIKVMKEVESRTPLYELQYPDGTKAVVFACRHLSKYNFHQQDFEQFTDRVINYVNSTKKAETTNRGLVRLNEETMNAIFDCVYGTDSHLKPATNSFLSDQNFKAFVSMLLTMQDYNYRHRNEEVRKLFPLFEKTIGPMERNSDGTTLFLALGLAVKELYGLRMSTFEALLESMK